MTTECRFCSPLPCEPDYHDAAQRVHATLVRRYWAEELDKTRAEAKKLWKARRTEKPDYRTAAQKERVMRGAHLGGKANKQILSDAALETLKGPRLRPSRAAYMRQYRKMHPEAK